MRILEEKNYEFLAVDVKTKGGSTFNVNGTYRVFWEGDCPEIQIDSLFIVGTNVEVIDLIAQDELDALTEDILENGNIFEWLDDRPAAYADLFDAYGDR